MICYSYTFNGYYIFFCFPSFYDDKAMQFYPIWAKKKATHCSCCIWDLSHLCGEFWLKDAKMWYSVRVVEQFSDKSRGLSESYPSTCSAIGVDNSRQLISTNKMQTKKQSRLSHWRFRTGSLRFSFLFFLFRVDDGFLRYFFLLWSTVMIRHPNEKCSKNNMNCFTTRTLQWFVRTSVYRSVKLKRLIV